MKRLFVILIIGLIAQISAAQTPKEKIDRYLNKAAQNNYSGSVLVAANGSIVLEKGYGFADTENKVPFTADTIFDIGSITKQFTAACILKLESQGKLSVQDPITKYFDNVPEDKKQIRLHHLLTHTAGLVDSLGSDEEFIGREEYLAKALSSKLIHPPGGYDYSNVGFSLLAAIVEKVSGQDYERYLNENLLKPAGMQNTGYVLPAWDKKKMAIGYENDRRWGTTYDQSQFPKGVTWHLKGNGGIHSTVGDMYLWYKALKGTSLLPEKQKEEYFKGHIEVADGQFYAYGWSTRKNERGETIIGHNGGNGYFMATMKMIPEKDFVVIASSNHAPKNTDVIAARIERLLLDHLQELDPDFIADFTGRYALPSGGSFDVWFDENDQAVLLLNNKEAWLLFSGSEKEDAKSQQFDQKTKDLMQAIFDSNQEKVASIAGVPPEEATDLATSFRKHIEQESGKWKSFETLGAVSRRQGKYHLTPVILHGEKSDAYRLIVWQDDQVMDFRPLPNGNTKEFEHKAGMEFYSPSNNRTITFEKVDKKPVLTIGTITAKWIKL